MGTGFTSETVAGGCISLSIQSALLAYFLLRLIVIYSEREHDFISNELFYSEEQMNDMDITLGAFNNSMNFIFGFTGGDMSTGLVDVMNNPYFRYVPLERRGGRVFYDKYEFDVCDDDFKRRFIQEHALNWYD